jgi:hypothetical protein
MNGELSHMVGRTPSSAPDPWSGFAGTSQGKPTWASAADEGVRPTRETNASA